VSVEYCVISIGALSHNRLWGEAAAVRTAHATTTLVADGKRKILVDPSLPAPALAARFNERTGRSIEDVTDVFCTTLRPVHRRSITAFAGTAWWCGEEELESYRSHLQGLLDSSGRLGDDQAGAIDAELKLLERFRPAPEKFGPQIHFYPLPGASVGSAGLLLAAPTRTIVVAGDAALTGEHVLRGQVWHRCADAAQAMRSLQDILEVADVIIAGHDNLILAPRNWL